MNLTKQQAKEIEKYMCPNCQGTRTLTSLIQGVFREDNYHTSSLFLYNVRRRFSFNLNKIAQLRSRIDLLRHFFLYFDWSIRNKDLSLSHPFLFFRRLPHSGGNGYRSKGVDD